MDEQKDAGTCTCGVCAMCKGGAMTGKMNCSPMHWSCCIVPLVSLIFWVASIVALVFAWVAGDTAVFGKADAFWYLNALALGVIAIGGRGKKPGMCRKGVCGSGKCGDCKDGTCK